MKYDDCVFKTSCDVDKSIKHEFREEFRKKSENFIQNLYELCQVDHSRKTSLLTIDRIILLSDTVYPQTNHSYKPRTTY